MRIPPLPNAAVLYCTLPNRATKRLVWEIYLLLVLGLLRCHGYHRHHVMHVMIAFSVHIPKLPPLDEVPSQTRRPACQPFAPFALLRPWNGPPLALVLKCLLVSTPVWRSGGLLVWIPRLPRTGRSTPINCCQFHDCNHLSYRPGAGSADIPG